jgi:phenylalanyl-tRNA synthetase alpha chain
MSEEDQMQAEYDSVDKIRDAFDEDYKRLTSLEARAALPLEAEEQLGEWEDLRVKYLGKKSELKAAGKKIKSMDPKSRRDFAMKIQKHEKEIELWITREIELCKELINRARAESESLDVTIPGRRPRAGHLHPITLMRQRIEDIFVSLG